MVIHSALAIHNTDTVTEFRIVSLDIHRDLPAIRNVKIFVLLTHLCQSIVNVCKIVIHR